MIEAILLARVILKKMVIKTNKYFKVTTNTYYISLWKFKVSFSESIKPPTKSDNSITPALSYYGTKIRVKFTGSCLKKSKI